jgi:hypothetical protein
MYRTASQRHRTSFQPLGSNSQEIAMNSIHRVGVTIAGVATAVVVAGAFVAQGYAAAQQAQQQATQAATAQALTGASTVPQIVYVNPQPTPQQTMLQATLPPPPVIHVVVPGYGGDDGGSDRG